MSVYSHTLECVKWLKEAWHLTRKHTHTHTHCQVIQQLKLLPLVAGETVEQKVASFRTMDDEVLCDKVSFVCECVLVCVFSDSLLSSGPAPGYHEHPLLTFQTHSVSLFPSSLLYIVPPLSPCVVLSAPSQANKMEARKL